ncbi:hypothetical protein [Streptomyces sp. AP-93]|uniref:hypothetical protein n=1 Tax=Streptomyces sp. AP-93 TaxID=2929048 RepID=UPI001FAEA12D|nr:hypothetical protein [Streptomyces sp. AP-93]MCJ0871629.1 hypothetical protein [Streptomyces sp. AP-93]
MTTRATRRIDDPAAAIAEAAGAPEGDLRSAAPARFAMDTTSLIRGQEDPQQAMRDLFDLLDLIEAGFGDTPA